MAHEHLVRDNDPFFSINADTREITYESKDKLVLIQGDHRSEVFTFTLPRYIDGHDMMDCNLVQVHFINIASSGGLRHSGLCQLTDLMVASEEDKDNLICTWLITNEATGYDGTLTFILRFACMNEDVVEYAWNTSIYSSVNILKSIYNSEEVAEQYIDILESWRKELIDSGLSGIDSINAARDEAINRIANTGGVIVSETEPEQEEVDVWVNPASEEEFVNLLTDQDIAQELSDDPNKVPSVALLKQIAEQGADLGDMETALDSIIAIQESLIGSQEESEKTITFTIDEYGTVKTYEAAEGMTWLEWVDTAYNTGGYFVTGNNATYCPDGVGMIMLNGSSVENICTIVAGAAYSV